jgi:hypothetical protein
MRHLRKALLPLAILALAPWVTDADGEVVEIGREVSMPARLKERQEFTIPLPELLEHGRKLFEAMWTVQEGAGRPLTKGTGDPLSDPAEPLVFPRNFNRVSGPDANSCAGCHNAPFGVPGGSGDIVANVFVQGQRFDDVTFEAGETLPTKALHDESGAATTLDSIANSRKTTGMFGSGYIEMLAREITADLRNIRDSLRPGETRELTSKGISFGVLRRIQDGRWDTFRVEGLPPASLATFGSDDPPSLIVHPWHQAGAVLSLRQFTNNALNHHHGIQPGERFGRVTDRDGDGFVNEMTRAEVTALTLYQAAMAVPGRVIPRNPVIEQAVLQGERKFMEVGCGGCHTPKLPLTSRGRLYREPGPYNPPGNLRRGELPDLVMDLNSDQLPPPRLQPEPDGVTWVPAFTDLKLHDITSGRDDPNREPLDMHRSPGTKAFFEGNGRFITRRLWGLANQGPYFHHGKFTTMREAILAHAGEAQAVTEAFRALSSQEQACIVEFLKSLRVLPPGTRHLIVDEKGQPRPWPPV